MLSSGLRKVMKALLILFAAAWITTDANATSEGERAPGLADKRFVSTYPYASWVFFRSCLEPKEVIE